MKKLVTLLFIISITSLSQAKISIQFDPTVPQMRIAAEKIEKSYASSPDKSDTLVSISFSIRPELGPETYALSSSNDGWNIAGGDTTGILYGAYELAGQIKLHGIGKVKTKSESPHFPFRAIKFNLPWSSYRVHEALQLHQETVRDLAYWEAFMDMMVENRFNVLSLWAIHPFTYMIRPENFPEACPFSDDELAEWQTYWKALFKMASDRGIETYIVWWNIFVSPEFAKTHNVADYSILPAHYGKGENNEMIDRYNRECVTQLINEYDDLTGVGVSLGERMLHIDAQEREQWILDVVVEGMRDAKRKVKFIHRAPFTRHAEITRKGIESLVDFPSPIWVEYKFNASHGHSTPKLTVTHGADINTAYWDPMPENYKMVWMMRNEDFMLLRWGQSDFIREHIDLNDHAYVGGYFVGSESYIPAKDYIQKRPDERINWTYAFERQWLFYRLWGKLLYNPDTAEQQFEDEFAHRYGKEPAATLYQTTKLAGNVALRIASFYRGSNDPSLTVEHFLNTRLVWNGGDTPFIHINEFIDHPVLEPSYLSIKDFVEKKQSNTSIPDTIVTPLELADISEAEASQTLALLDTIKSTPGSIDYEIADVAAWSHLGLYFAEKLRGGVALQTYRVNGDKSAQKRAVAHLQKALIHWKRLAEVTDVVYNEVPSVKLLYLETPEKLSWKALIKHVENDIRIAETAR